MTSSAPMGAVLGGGGVGGLLRQVQPVGEGGVFSLCLRPRPARRRLPKGGVAGSRCGVKKRCVGRAAGGRLKGCRHRRKLRCCGT